ncbi:MAG TPA: hypothetical protein VH796_13150 [Nitrososphaeraceae archaeon]|jgi:hypothetical protein
MINTCLSTFLDSSKQGESGVDVTKLQEKDRKIEALTKSNRNLNI